MCQRTDDRGQRAEDRGPSSVSGAGGFFLLFLLLLINFLGGAMKTSLPLEPRPVRKVFVQDSGKMSPFQRLTLGIPISVNTDTALGLTAVPGIGPKTAAAIVSARERTGGFTQLNELLSIRGISASLYHKISPYLTL